MMVREALSWARTTLEGHRCPGAEARRESEELLEAVTGRERSTAAAEPEADLTAQQQREFAALVRRRAAHEPLAYILGTAWFRGREFAVSSATLIPRPATEHIIDAALEAAEGVADPLFIDVGTGSGCIAVSLAVERPDCKVLATDASASALAVARKNAVKHRVADRVTFVRTDLLTASFRAGTAPVIVANLPYIPSAAMRALSPDILDHEPKNALDGGPDGLDLYRSLVMRLRSAKLSRGLTLIAELLPDQYGPLAALVRERFPRARCSRVVNHQKVTVGLTAKIPPA